MKPIEKDRLWRRKKELNTYIKGRMCTKSEMWKPTEHNALKHIKEQRLTDEAVRERKEIIKKLGEDPKSRNKEGLRPRR